MLLGRATLVSSIFLQASMIVLAASIIGRPVNMPQPIGIINRVWLALAKSSTARPWEFIP